MRHKSILITGAAGGIGRSLVSGLANAGWNVIASDLPSEKVQENAGSLPGKVRRKSHKVLENSRKSLGIPV